MFTKSALLTVLLTGSCLAQAAEPIHRCTIEGDPKAQITIQEFSDFECPYCAKGAETMSQIIKKYPGKVRLVFRNMPLPMHAHALVAAKVFTAICLQGDALGDAFQKTIFSN